MAEKLKFTKGAVAALVPQSKRTYYQDTKEPLLGLYVTPTGSKSFFARLYIDGGIKRRPIGQFPSLSVPRARELAADAASNLTERGIDIAKERRRNKAISLTLEEAREDYLRAKDLKPGTIKDYRRAIEENYGEWLKKPLANISERDVLTRYRERGKVSQARTDNGLRVLRAIFNYARAAYKDPNGQRYYPNNPTDIVGEAKIRFRPRRKRRVVALEDLPEWWKAVHGLNNIVARDLLVFLLLTGARKTEASSLRWENVDFRRQIFRLIDTKNRQTVELPLPAYVADLVHKRKGRKKSGWVFPAPTGKLGYLADPRKSIDLVKAGSGVTFSAHDLRRSFVSTASGLDINAFTIRWLCNHKLNPADVTQGYDVPDLARLREASGRIEDKLLRSAKAKEGTVIRLRRKA